jgi:hypothetical protein
LVGQAVPPALADVPRSGTRRASLDRGQAAPISRLCSPQKDHPDAEANGAFALPIFAQTSAQTTTSSTPKTTTKTTRHHRADKRTNSTAAQTTAP